jgi:hypothetical protein
VNEYSISDHTNQWAFFVKVSFAIAISSTLVGIYMLPGALMVKGYFLISALFLVFSTITLSKTVRDDHEAQRLHNKISEARTSKMIRDLETE